MKGAPLLAVLLAAAWAGPAAAQTLAPPPPEGGVLLDGVAAVVEREVITRSDVERMALLHLVKKGGASVPGGLTVDNALRAAVLDLLIAEELVLLDARRNQRFPETDDDVALQSARIRSRFPSEQAFLDFLAAAQIPEQEFQEMMRREARVDRMVAIRMRTAEESAVEVARALAEHPELQRPDLDDKAVAQQARTLAGQLAASRYVQGIREHTPVRVVARFDVPPTDGRP